MNMSASRFGIARTSLALTLALGLCLSQQTARAADEQSSTLADQQSVAVTIYNSELALVKDERRITLPRGSSRLAFRDVSARINPATALLRSLTAAGALSIWEQNFNYDLLTPQKLLDKYVGRTVTVIHSNPATGHETRETAKVLSTNDGVVLEYSNRIETGVDGRLAFSSLPQNLRDVPTLVIDLENAVPQTQSIELSYLTGGLSWHADYVGELNADDSRLDLNGLITLDNQSGTTYRNAKLQLVAGDVNRVTTDMFQAKVLGRAMAAPANSVSNEALLEYHLYTLSRPTTIADKQTKQVALLAASNIPVTKSLELRGDPSYYTGSFGDLGQKIKFGVYVQFRNDGAGLGIPLPKGTVRIYKKDSHGNAQFVGEDAIDHTPRHENIRLRLGEAFDVTANKKQTNYRYYREGSVYVYETSFELELHNAKDKAQPVKIVEPMPGINWQVISENYHHVKGSADTAVWNINIPANGKTTLIYTVQVRMPV
ncbi:MAG: DUF4139 domain-containing protein [Candidatus Eremiobacteraeota bacterium]|nr:DUF4139 domain-containing protein [Candidatus Eremiobacteraeota bacterium]